MIDHAEAAAGRLLLRYGWRLEEEKTHLLLATDKQSHSNRIMNDEHCQEAALVELGVQDETAVERLVEMCRSRDHERASHLARMLVFQYQTVPDIERAADHDRV